MKKDEITSPAIKEYMMAFEEYFKDKPKPKNDEESKAILEKLLVKDIKKYMGNPKNETARRGGNITAKKRLRISILHS